MANVIQNDSTIVVKPWWERGAVIYIGLAVGLLWWVLTALLRQYVVEPIACRDLSTASVCVNSLDVSGNIAAVLVAAVGVFLLVRAYQPRPIIIAVATLALLWGIGGLMAGLPWYVVLLAGLFFYGVSYALFSLVTRINRTWLAVVVTLVIVAGVRLLLAI